MLMALYGVRPWVRIPTKPLVLIADDFNLHTQIGGMC